MTDITITITPEAIQKAMRGSFHFERWLTEVVESSIRTQVSAIKDAASLAVGSALADQSFAVELADTARNALKEALAAKIASTVRALPQAEARTLFDRMAK